jgi:hypothetical protein
MSQLAAHVRNELRASVAIQQAYGRIEFVIDGGPELPSPTQMQVLPGESLFHEASIGSETSDSSSVNPQSHQHPSLDR